MNARLPLLIYYVQGARSAHVPVSIQYTTAKADKSMPFPSVSGFLQKLTMDNLVCFVAPYTYILSNSPYDTTPLG